MNSTGFLSVEEIALRELALRRDRFAAWQEARNVLSRHPSVLLHLDFERTNLWENSLANRAHGAVARADAALVGCTLSDGRWRGKGAAEFRRPTDRLRLDLGTNLGSITLVAWLRVAALPNTQNSLLMTDGFERGEVHWYLYGNGAIGFGVHLENDDPRGWRNFHSGPAITRAHLGQWLCVATTYDGASDRVTHFLNGEPLGSHVLGFNGRLLLDQFEIGNWAVQPEDPRWRGVKLRGPRDHIRFFQGRMDEFAVFGSALSEREIRLIYQAGSPGLTSEIASAVGGAR